MIGANNVISTKRLTQAANKESFGSSYNLANLPCYLEQVDPKVAVMFGENAFKTYLAIVDGAVDVAESDLVVDWDDTEYIVSGVQTFENDEIDDHTEITMIKKYVKT